MTTIISILKAPLSRNIFRNEQGMATIQYMFVIVTITLFMFFVVTQAVNITAQHQLKSAVNRAVKAAAHAYSDDVLALEGNVDFDEAEARQKFDQYLEDNIRGIDMWDVETFQVVEGGTFPRSVSDGRLTHMFENPGIWAVVKADIPKFGGGMTTLYTSAIAEVAVTVDD
ncbi:MAG: hypothetical protein LOD88_12065 [Novibacillus thermophilus]|nr:hypothetical protein [Novibacillus thermophilus]